MANYRPNVARHLRSVLRDLGPIDSLLDFGAGNGWILNQMLTTEVLVGSARAVDVQRRDRYHMPVDLYDGDRLPFDDGEFDTSMAVDVIHHCPRPADALREIARVTRRYLVLKDHTFQGALGFVVLSALDEIGNRKFGIPNRYRYQRAFAWDDVLGREGFVVRKRVSPLPCHDGPLTITDRLQCLVVYERVPGRP